MSFLCHFVFGWDFLVFRHVGMMEVRWLLAACVLPSMFAYFFGGSRVGEGKSMECRSVCDCWCQNEKPELNRSSILLWPPAINLPNRNSDPSFAGYLPIQHANKVQRCKSKNVLVFIRRTDSSITPHYTAKRCEMLWWKVSWDSRGCIWHNTVHDSIGKHHSSKIPTTFQVTVVATGLCNSCSSSKAVESHEKQTVLKLLRYAIGYSIDRLCSRRHGTKNVQNVSLLGSIDMWLLHHLFTRSLTTQKSVPSSTWWITIHELFCFILLIDS